MKYSFLAVITVFVLVGCSSDKDVAIKPVEKAIPIEKDVAKSPPKLSESIPSVTNPDWITYTNEKHGISVDHPKGWSTSEFKSFSPLQVPGGIDCTEEPELCKYTSFNFTSSTQPSPNREGLSITIAEKNGSELLGISKNQEWLTGLIEGCNVTQTIPGAKASYVFHAFATAKNPKNTKQACDSGFLMPHFDLMVQSFSEL